MRNAKQELLNAMGSSITDLRCATITYNPFYDERPKKMVLKEGYTQADLDEFISKLDFEYDAGYGSQELFGHKYPSIPDELKEGALPEPDTDYPDDYDDMINQMINQEYDENNQPEHD